MFEILAAASMFAAYFMKVSEQFAPGGYTHADDLLEDTTYMVDLRPDTLVRIKQVGVDAFIDECDDFVGDDYSLTHSPYYCDTCQMSILGPDAIPHMGAQCSSPSLRTIPVKNGDVDFLPFDDPAAEDRNEWDR